MPNDVGATLKKLREDADVTVKAVSEYLIEKGFKANPSTIYSWETGNSQPTPGALLAMCKLYGVPDVLAAFGYDGYDDEGGIQLNLKETQLIEKYRTLDAYGSDLVDTVLEKEYERCQNQTTIDVEELRKLPLSERLKFEPYINDGYLKVARKRKE